MRIITCLIGIVILSMACSGDHKELTGGQVGELVTRASIGYPAAESKEDFWLPNEQRAEFVNSLLDYAKKHPEKVFYFLPGELIPYPEKELEDLFIKRDTDYIYTSETAYDVIPYVDSLEGSGIAQLKFKEMLYWDASKGTIQKKVTHIAPMEVSYDESGEIRGYVGLFWLKVD